MGEGRTGGDVLYTHLRELFTKQYEPTALHRVLGFVPGLVRRWRKEGRESLYQLIITTNYDDAWRRHSSGWVRSTTS